MKLSEKAIQTPLVDIDFNVDLTQISGQKAFLGDNEFEITSFYYHNFYSNGTVIDQEWQMANLHMIYKLSNNLFLPVAIDVKTRDAMKDSLSVQDVLDGLKNNQVKCKINLKFLNRQFPLQPGKHDFEKIKHNDNALIFQDVVHSNTLNRTWDKIMLSKKKIKEIWELDFAKFMKEVKPEITYDPRSCNQLILGKIKSHENTRDILEYSVRSCYDPHIFFNQDSRLVVVTVDPYDGRSIKGKPLTGGPSFPNILENLKSKAIINGEWNINISDSKVMVDQINEIRNNYIIEYSQNSNIL